MKIRFQKPADAFLEILLTEAITYFREHYGDPNTVDPKFFGVCAKAAVKEKFIVTIKESSRNEMNAILASRGRLGSDSEDSTDSQDDSET